MYFGAKFVATSSYNRQVRASAKEKGSDVSFDANVGGFGIEAEAGYSSSNNESKKKSSKSDFSSVNMYTIGTYLPDGKDFKEKLEKWT